MRPLFLCLFLVVLAPAAAHADSLRCGDLLVHTDDPAGKVLATCGEPTYRDERYSRWRDFAYETEETWTYNFGPQHFMKTLRFRNGRLVEIESGSYGYADYASDTPPEEPAY